MTEIQQKVESPWMLDQQANVEIGAKTNVGGGVAIHQFVKVGPLAMLGGGCALSKDVPPYCIVGALSLNEVRGLNQIGLKRSGMSADDRRALKDAFKLFYRSGLNVTQGLAAVRETAVCEAVDTFCDFVEHSKRGVCSFSANARGVE